MLAASDNNGARGAYMEMKNLQEQTESLRAAKAILKGLKARYEATGRRPIILHTVSICIASWC